MLVRQVGGRAGAVRATGSLTHRPNLVEGVLLTLQSPCCCL